MQKDKPWEIFKTMHCNGLQASLQLMTDEDVDLNIIEIHLVSLYNENIEKWLIETMKKISYYLQYRYIFESVMNGTVTIDHRKKINMFLDQFDIKYINGSTTEISENTQSNGNQQSYENKLRRSMMKKQIKCKFISAREEFILKLSELSENINTLATEEEKQLHFQETIDEINKILSESTQKLQIDSCESQKSEEDLSKMHGYCFYYKKKLHKISRVNKIGSFFIKTKNRSPLVMNFDFMRFIYKNDDQLSHELIAMKLIKYINKLLGKQFIIEYEILPQCKGALYEFVQKSLTINHIKKVNKGGIVEYLQFLSEGNEEMKQKLVKRFAETYSGFCLAQYLLDIKDRNNANIMIRQDGSIFHIDLAFIFESCPGGINFESAPFKMPKQYVKLLGGFDSDAFKLFETLLIQHFTKLSECKDQLLFKLDILSRRNKQIRCFMDYKYLTFKRKIPTNQQKIKSQVEDLIDKSYDSWKTNKYDEYQFKTNDIMK